MNSLLRVISILLLLFNGLGALYGGWILMSDPTGGTLGLPLGLLRGTPFNSYAAPGIVLFIANGICSMVVVIFVGFKWRYYDWLIIFQGWVLLGWIIIQMMMLSVRYYLQYVLGCTGVVLALLGILLVWQNHREVNAPAR